MTTQIQHAIESFLEDDESVTLADGFDEAFLGIARQFNKPFAVYDRSKCLAALINQGMTPEEASEYFSFNTEGAWVGDSTPAFLSTSTIDSTSPSFLVVETLAKQIAVTTALLRILADHADPKLARNGEEEEACEAALKATRRLLDMGGRDEE